MTELFNNYGKKYDNLPFAPYNLGKFNRCKRFMTRKERIYDVLSSAFKTDSLLIEDESHRHHVPPDAESHFKITAVSPAFENLNRIARHRLINNLLALEFTNGLHALSLHLYTPVEWTKKASVPASPACRDGKRHG